MKKTFTALLIAVFALSICSGCAKKLTLDGTTNETVKKSYVKMWKKTPEKGREKLHYAYMGVLAINLGFADRDNWKDWEKAHNNLLDGKDADWILKHGTPYMDAFLADWDNEIAEMEEELKKYEQQGNQSAWTETDEVLQDYKTQRQKFLLSPEQVYKEYFK